MHLPCSADLTRCFRDVKQLFFARGLRPLCPFRVHWNPFSAHRQDFVAFENSKRKNHPKKSALLETCCSSFLGESSFEKVSTHVPANFRQYWNNWFLQPKVPAWGAMLIYSHIHIGLQKINAYFQQFLEKERTLVRRGLLSISILWCNSIPLSIPALSISIYDFKYYCSF